MKIDQLTWNEVGVLDYSTTGIDTKGNANLILAFGGRSIVENQEWYQDLRDIYPSAKIISCSTAGEIIDTQVNDDTLVVTAIEFEKTPFHVHVVNNQDIAKSHDAGIELANAIDTNGLAHVLVFSNGHTINGTELVNGMYDVIQHTTPITGGLAGDGADFAKTVVGIDDNSANGNIVAIAFYGEDVQIGHGSRGGWDAFGPKRLITKSVGNVLFEMDDKNALELYKSYLGDKAAGLPGTALLFPLEIIVEGKEGSLVRTILAIDENEGSMTFAGDIPQGAIAQLMKYNSMRLIDGAFDAAAQANDQTEKDSELAILISCVGRKLVLGQRIEEEVEAVRDELGDNTALTGFYSYGEICPILSGHSGELHNQTMTITTISE